MCLPLKTCSLIGNSKAEMDQMQTFFSMEHKAKLQPCRMARLQMSASIHSDFPELGTPVTMDSSPGTTWSQPIVSSQTTMPDCHVQDIADKG